MINHTLSLTLPLFINTYPTPFTPSFYTLHYHAIFKRLTAERHFGSNEGLLLKNPSTIIQCHSTVWPLMSNTSIFWFYYFYPPPPLLLHSILIVKLTPHHLFLLPFSSFTTSTLKFEYSLTQPKCTGSLIPPTILYADNIILSQSPNTGSKVYLRSHSDRSRRSYSSIIYPGWPHPSLYTSIGTVSFFPADCLSTTKIGRLKMTCLPSSSIQTHYQCIPPRPLYDLLVVALSPPPCLFLFFLLLSTLKGVSVERMKVWLCVSSERPSYWVSPSHGRGLLGVTSGVACSLSISMFIEASTNCQLLVNVRRWV